MSPEISIPILIDCFSDLPNPRIDRCKRHRLIDIVVTGLCAVICGAEGPTEMETFGNVKKKWLEQFLELPHGVPSHDTFGCVLSVIDPQEFERCLLKWVNAHAALAGGLI
jgi:DDE_Tnp_1-associated